MTITISGNTAKAKAIYYGRWLTLLPAALFVGIGLTDATTAVLNFMVTVRLIESESFLRSLVFSVLPGLVMSVTFIYTGVRIAPAHKTRVALVLATLYVAAQSSVVGFVWRQGAINPWVVCSYIVMLTGTTGTVCLLRRTMSSGQQQASACKEEFAAR